MAELLDARIVQAGNSWAVRIPKALIDCKVLDPSKPVRVVLVQDEQKGGTGVIYRGGFLDAAVWPRTGEFADAGLVSPAAAAEAL